MRLPPDRNLVLPGRIVVRDFSVVFWGLRGLCVGVRSCVFFVWLFAHRRRSAHYILAIAGSLSFYCYTLHRRFNSIVRVQASRVLSLRLCTAWEPKNALCLLFSVAAFAPYYFYRSGYPRSTNVFLKAHQIMTRMFGSQRSSRHWNTLACSWTSVHVLKSMPQLEY